MKGIFIYGSGGHSKVLIDLIEKSGEFIIKGIIDIENIGSELFGYEIMPITRLLKLKEDDQKFFIAIGNNQIRQKVAVECKEIPLAIIKSRFSSISPRINIGQGTVIMPGVTVNAMANIGENCILNTNCSIDHDCVIKDFVHISPNATLCGNVTINHGTHIGAGATIIPGITIGKWCTIGAGSVIIRDIPDNSVVVGNPGKIIKQKNNE